MWGPTGQEPTVECVGMKQQGLESLAQAGGPARAAALTARPGRLKLLPLKLDLEQARFMQGQPGCCLNAIGRSGICA